MREKRMGNAIDVVAGDHVRGSGSSRSTILVYGDYECPYTRQFEQSLARLRSGHPERSGSHPERSGSHPEPLTRHSERSEESAVRGKLRERVPASAGAAVAVRSFRSVFRFFPLREIHPHAQAAAEAAECVFMLAGDDAFWTMHDGLFANQHALDEAGLERRGEEAGVDAKKLRAALADHRAASRVERDIESGFANGVNGTPSIFLNGERYSGPRDPASLMEALQREG